VWLRRAVSTAYYALFHAITMQAADSLLPSGTAEHGYGSRVPTAMGI
jgi:hypothetical protein